MPLFELRATIRAPRIIARKIPQSLAIELKKRKYKALGVQMETLQITELIE